MEGGREGAEEGVGGRGSRGRCSRDPGRKLFLKIALLPLPVSAGNFAPQTPPISTVISILG